jgi:hypothetical protein|tara:strand:- start:8034 stop:8240 length:207 start_codon:yes stop_codon:yes gene_type:complete
MVKVYLDKKLSDSIVDVPTGTTVYLSPEQGILVLRIRDAMLDVVSEFFISNIYGYQIVPEEKNGMASD